ncbi:hypothetical protein NZL82_01660 [Sphingomonas sanguinis]|uniref:hypothetical protein n=1 Tax=Sphingomonas sp. LC-1 TaxID=3110957 RepID=UPI0021BBB3CE|nr:hypothetical protein [Sphingomonas sp. LC-1]MCT8000578.1 hypothetical protein [Sphingomonas sp. LC-1]
MGWSTAGHPTDTTTLVERIDRYMVPPTANGGMALVFGLLNKVVISKSIDMIAKKAASPEAFNKGVSTSFSTPEAIEGYFQRYGSTERKFDRRARFLFGYVKVEGREFLSLVFPAPNATTLASFEPDFPPGQDFMSLMARKEFADRIAGEFDKASAGR